MHMKNLGPNPTTKAMRKGGFQPPTEHLGNNLADFDDTLTNWNYGTTPKDCNHAKFDFDPTTWVVWANTQFATLQPQCFFVCFWAASHA